MAKLFSIPVMAPRMGAPKREYPISPKENIMRAFRHEKPMWMPNNTNAIQRPSIPAFEDMPVDFTKDGADWFGIQYKYEEVQKSPTAVSTIFEEIDEWREKMHFPNMNARDWKAGLESFVPEVDKALGVRLGAGIFERLHFCEGFEQALCDILLEQDECRAFFNRMGEYKVEAFKHMNEALHPDIAAHNDDWSNARAPFFSNEVYENTLLDSAVELANAVHESGVRYQLHCCGCMEAFLPYIVNNIKADVLEIQTINDFRMILDRYGSKTTPIFAPDPYIMYDSDLKPEEAREYARSIVDKYGAHTYEGSGVIVKLVGSKPETYYAFEDEIFHYSLECYKKFN